MAHTAPSWARPVSLMVTPQSVEGIGLAIRAATTSGHASATWPAANLAIHVPVTIARRVVVTHLFWSNGATASGNVDCGIYDAAGNLLVSTGSTAQSGTQTLQSVDITDLTLNPGRYYIALAMDGTTGTTVANGSGTASQFAALGLAQQASAFALPNPATQALYAQTLVPIFGFSQRASPI